MASLDQRIADLQSRIRKKRAANQQQENLYNLATQNQLRSGTGHKIGSRPLSANIAAVEPYIKHDPKEHISQDINKNNTDKQYGISKQDPKYQTLPYNIKFPAGNGSGDAKKDSEKSLPGNYNNKEESEKLKSDSTQGKPGSALDYLPKEIIHNAPDFKPSVGHATAFEAMPDTLKDSNLPLTTPSKNTFGGYKPPTSLSNLTPRPFGSTYSTSSILTNRPTVGTTTPQNSPGNNTTLSSSFGYQGIPGYPKTSTPLASTDNHARSGYDDTREILITGPHTSPPNRIEPTSSTSYSSNQYQQPLSVVTSGAYQSESSNQLSHSPRTGPPVYQVASSRLQPVQVQHTVAPPSPASSSGSTGSSQRGPQDRPAGGPPPYGYHKSQQAFSSSMPSSVAYSRAPTSSEQYTNNPTISHQSRVPFSASVSQYDTKVPTSTKDPLSISQRSSTLPVGAPNGDDKRTTKETDISSALSVLKSGPSTTIVNTKPSYRYAPKSVIANTYMRRLGPGALDQYRKNMNQLYSQLLPGQTAVLGESSNTPSSPTAKVHPLNVESNTKPQNKAEQSPPEQSEHEHSGSQDSSEGSENGKGVPPAYRAAPPYDMDVERMRYQTNAPKLRRRSSSGESDFSHHRNTSQGERYNSSSQNVSLRATSPEKEMDHSQADTTPDIVRLDDLQDSYNNNKVDNDPFDKAVIPLSEADRESPEEPREGEPTVRENLPVALRGKKGNLRTAHSSSRHSRRVSFDPLALLLDASLEGELALVKRTAKEVNIRSFMLSFTYFAIIQS